MLAARTKTPKRQLDSTIIHFDYDCFYASVIENESPQLKSRPLAVQQKQIIVTCNYEARRRGLYKLQLISEAKKICPDVVIVLGEDLTRFRNASKQLYGFLRSFSWNSQCERLGFDEVFMDVSDIIAYNASILNYHDLGHSFFCLSRSDPTFGFPFDASTLAAHTEPDLPNAHIDISTTDPLQLRLLLASHLAQHLRQRLESEKGYTATVGISTNKLLAKLVGNLHKPNGQTTLLPPYFSVDAATADNVTVFMDEHEVGKVPGIGFKIAQKLRAHVLGRPAEFDAGLVYGGTKENVRVGQVRVHPGMGPALLERILGGPGAPHGIGARVWDLINGCDDIPVGLAREVPTQISIEDSYTRLDTVDQIIRELRMLAQSLLKRMYLDLLEDDDDEHNSEKGGGADAPHESIKRWMAHPRTIRLSTRPRPPQNPDGSRNRSFARISKSTSMPNFVFNLKENLDSLVERLVFECLLPLFRRLHPEKSGWNLSLVNIAACNITTAARDKGGEGKNIAKMFKRQDGAIRQDDVTFDDQENANVVYTTPEAVLASNSDVVLQDMVCKNSDYLLQQESGSEDVPTSSQASINLVDHWISEGDAMVDLDSYQCVHCGAVMPLFAMGAHDRWHAQN